MFEITLLSVILLQNFIRVTAKPYTLIISGKPNCIQLDIPKATKIAINYDAPDLVPPGEKNAEIEELQYRFEKELTDSHVERSKLNHPPEVMNKYERGRKDNLQAMVTDMATSYADMVITVRKKKGRLLETFRLNEKKEGTFEYSTIEDGVIQICTQGVMASRSNPRRISLQVFVVTETVKRVLPEQKEVENHYITLEDHLYNFMDETDSILKTAEYSKIKEAEFYKQSEDMNYAATWWPFLQILVLLGTGFTQFKYVVHFFKNRGVF